MRLMHITRTDSPYKTLRAIRGLWEIEENCIFICRGKFNITKLLSFCSFKMLHANKMFHIISDFLLRLL